MRARELRYLPLVAALAYGGCADLTLEPNLVPSSLVIAPADTVLTVGDRAGFRVSVLDQNGDPIEPQPSWTLPVWATSDPNSARISQNGHVEAVEYVQTEVIASFAGLVGRTRLRVNPESVVLSAPSFYLTQSVQDSDGRVPLIAGRQALLRVFATADRASFYRPRATALFYHGDKLSHGAVMKLGSAMVPAEVDEGRLEQSYNATIPASVVQPGTEILIELDRDGVVPLGPGSQLRIPAEGRLTLDIRTLPRFDLTVVPIQAASDPDGRIYQWTEGMTSESEALRLARAVLPIADMWLTVHEGYVTSADLTTGAGWGELLGELILLRVKEGRRGYYYGAVELADEASWVGLASIGYPAGVGEASPQTLAHELGHTLGLRHAPCGGASAADIAYPYEGGVIGAWGYDFHGERLVDASLYKDVMGYCNPEWVSDYHFKRALAFRRDAESALVAQPMAAALEPAGKTLLLWGRVGGGELVLDPAFMMDLPVTLPEKEGPYRLEGLGPAGERRFSLSFTPRPVEFGGGNFLFALPFDPGRDGALARVVLSGPEGSFTLEQSGASPMAIVTDPGTGRLRAVLRNWRGGRADAPLLLDGAAEITVSEGLPSPN